MTKKKEIEPYGKCEAFSADPFRKHLVPQPRKPWEKRLMIESIKAHLEELEALLPDEPDELDEDSTDEEPDDPEFLAYMKKVNKLRREARGLKRRK